MFFRPQPTETWKFKNSKRNTMALDPFMCDYIHDKFLTSTFSELDAIAQLNAKIYMEIRNCTNRTHCPSLEFSWVLFSSLHVTDAEDPYSFFLRKHPRMSHRTTQTKKFRIVLNIIIHQLTSTTWSLILQLILEHFILEIFILKKYL